MSQQQDVTAADDPHGQARPVYMLASGDMLKVLPSEGEPLKLAASGWGKTVAAVTTASSLFVAFGADIKIDQLTTTGQITLFTVLMIAFIGGLVATLLAFLAEFDDGHGYTFWKWNVSQLGLLKKSIGAAIIAAVCVALAPMVFFAFQHDQPESPDLVEYLVTLGAEGRVLCGEIIPDAEGNLFLAGEPLTNVTAITRAEDGCPKLVTATP